MAQLKKAIVFAKDHGLTSGLFGPISVTRVVAVTSALGVWEPATVTTPIVVMTIILSITLEDELNEKYDALERENFAAEKELAELWAKGRLADSLQEEVDLYGSLSMLVAQITKLKASFAEG
ncbi:unnamed protein product [Vicia faba]|uniref:Uncharacterized protein n=1 Tax=Vicia faba TaxID=3906 RepID=A0AAV0ZLQ7_VICFA|nr:unnamed protein product [Vicia faba]